jgi:hypothetical protein
VADHPAGAAGAGDFQYRPPAPGAVRGPAFSIPFKVAATVLVVAVYVLLLRSWHQGRLGESMGAAWVGVSAALAWSWWMLLRSTSGIDATRVHQTWLWDKQVPIADLAHARLIRVRGLDWLVAPRLYARTTGGRIVIFHSADPAVVAEFERLVTELANHHRMR